MNETIHTPSYLIEGDNAQYRVQAEKALARAKEIEATKKSIPVWYDHNTIKLVTLEKIQRRKLEIIKVKIGKGELAWMERKRLLKTGL